MTEAGKRYTKPSHRLSYEMHIGEIPSGMRVLHRCDNPPCIRPDHLFLGTDLDNVRDATSKGRRAWQKRSANV